MSFHVFDQDEMFFTMTDPHGVFFLLSSLITQYPFQALCSDGNQSTGGQEV